VEQNAIKKKGNQRVNYASEKVLRLIPLFRTLLAFPEIKTCIRIYP
jgi:hypothetical protein